VVVNLAVYKVASWSLPSAQVFTDTASNLASLIASQFAVMASVSSEGTIKKKERSDAFRRIQTLLQVIQKSESIAGNSQRVSLRDAIVIQSQAPGIPPSGKTEAASISGADSRTTTVETAVACQYSCEHHLGWMDPLLWSTLPRDLLGLIFARISIPKIIDLCVLSMQWSTMSKSPVFRKVFSERYPKLFELVGRDKAGKLLDVVYDVRCSESTFRGGILRACSTRPFPFPSLTMSPFGFHRVNDTYGYGIPWKESDGGLVCFMPRQKLLTVPFLVGNPLTDEWKALPCIPLVNKQTNKDPAVVQLVMDEDTICYRVMVMVYNFITKEYASYCFDSRTGVWMCEECSLAYGDGCSRLSMTCTMGGDQRDFDRRTKMLYDLVYRSSLKGAAARRSAMVKDRLFVLHHQGPSGRSVFRRRLP